MLATTDRKATNHTSFEERGCVIPQKRNEVSTNRIEEMAEGFCGKWRRGQDSNLFSGSSRNEEEWN
jgi:hypothetical protein